MGQILRVLTAVHEHDVTSNAPNEGLGHTAHDRYHADSQSEARNPGKHEDQGTIAEGPSEVSPEHLSGDDHVGKDAHDTVHSGRSGGECLCPGNTLLSLTIRTCRKRLERKGHWECRTCIRCCQGCCRSVRSPQGCPRSRLHRIQSIQGSFVTFCCKIFLLIRSSGNCRCQGQGRSSPFTRRRAGGDFQPARRQ